MLAITGPRVRAPEPVARPLAESRIVKGFEAELLKPECLEFFKREVRRITDAKRAGKHNDEAIPQARWDKLEGAIANVVDASYFGLLAPTVRAKLEAGEAEMAKLTPVLARTGTKSPTSRRWSQGWRIPTSGWSGI